MRVPPRIVLPLVVPNTWICLCTGGSDHCATTKIIIAYYREALLLLGTQDHRKKACSWHASLRITPDPTEYLSSSFDGGKLTVYSIKYIFFFCAAYQALSTFMYET